MTTYTSTDTDLTTAFRSTASGAWLQRWAARLRRVDPGAQRVSDAAAVRALADSCRESDRGFASDLYAAADRHERSLV